MQQPQRIRKIVWQDFNGKEKSVEGDATKWIESSDTMTFHGSDETIRVPKSKIVSDREFNSGCCFISTAIYANFGFDDDCSDLKLLRNYRDDYLLKTKEGQKIVDNYYLIAPIIVNQIEMFENKKEIYSDIYDQHLKNIVYLVNNNKLESASEKYEEMVKELITKYNIKIKISLNN